MSSPSEQGAERGSAHEIVWRLRLHAPPAAVYDLLADDQGRASFWAERTVQRDESLTFHFPGGETLESRVLVAERPRLFVLTYFGGSTARFELSPEGSGTILCLRESGIASEHLDENRAGWVSVLLNLKARADHGVDLRNHDPACSWAQGFVDN